MNKRLPFVLLSVLLAVTAGCSNKRTQEFDARLESAENNAATARLRADEAYMKAEQAQATASQALRTADEDKVRASRMTDKATRK
ncbi:outer membrane lipoprotein OprI [Pseudomonas frederiksbergensis]|uniref:Lpp/OprI family alanine-zipper lipoprotein n=1 Tax=Pseudomonas frederiksbergensis TaxID=104087 RepID=UPI000958B4A8|nr:Lpp/OprI family alanine-zipper lipoprotein [Pseudomonas frederiksbergensis]APV42607.1 outer membrane lipoprotein OprI [Pseudomonas frederiksbergensis]